MTSLQPLLVLLDQHQRQRDAALAVHHRAQAESRAAQAQAAELLTYRRDYEERWRTQFAREGRMELVNCYHGFMERLTQAVEQQQSITELAAGRVAGALARLQECEMRCASVQKLIERRTVEQRQADDRRDQKQTDEFAARAAWARAADRPPSH